MNGRTKKLTAVAMLCAMAYIMAMVARVPIVLFLKYDPKDIIVTLGGFLWGPLTSCMVSVILSVLQMFTTSGTGIWGCIMNMMSTCSFSCTAAYLYKRNATPKGAACGLLAGTISMAAVMLVWNYLVAPVYMGVSREEIVPLLLSAFLPFNLIKGGINAGVTFVLYRPLVAALQKIRVL